MNVNCQSEFDPPPLLETTVEFLSALTAVRQATGRKDGGFKKRDKLLCKKRPITKSGGGLIRTNKEVS